MTGWLSRSITARALVHNSRTASRKIPAEGLHGYVNGFNNLFITRVKILEFQKSGVSDLCASPSLFIAFKDKIINCLGIKFYDEMLRTLKQATELFAVESSYFN